MYKLISVIIPNYNKCEYLHECVTSVIEQTYPNIEIVIVDDCSTDDSLKVLDSIDFKNRIFKIVKKIERDSLKLCQRAANSRNIGIIESSGELISTLDSDDVYLSEHKLQEEYNLLKKSNFNCIIYSNVNQIDSDSNFILSEGNDKNMIEGNLYQYMLKYAWSVSEFFSPRDYLLPKKFLVDVGLYDESYILYEDWDLKIRLSEKYEFKYSGIDGIGYRRMPGGLSYQEPIVHQQIITEIRNKYIKL